MEPFKGSRYTIEKNYDEIRAFDKHGNELELMAVVRDLNEWIAQKEFDDNFEIVFPATIEGQTHWRINNVLDVPIDERKETAIRSVKAEIAKEIEDHAYLVTSRS